MKKLMVLAAMALGALALAPAAAQATAPHNQSAWGTYGWFLEEPNSAMASNGDTLTLFDSEGEFTISNHTRSADGGGSFTHTMAGGGSVTGTWTVNGLVDFQPYGCGVFMGDPIPDFLCGGRLVLDATLHTPIGDHPVLVTVMCLIGYPPPSAAEGIRVVVPGIANFNQPGEGMNVYVKQ